MTNCPLYNGQNLIFTGNENPYALIQKAGKRGKTCKKGKRGKTCKTGKRCIYKRTRKYRCL